MVLFEARGLSLFLVHGGPHPFLHPSHIKVAQGARTCAGRDGSTLEEILQISIVVVIQTTHSERVRAERLYQQLDLLQPVRREARRQLLAESHKHSAVKLLRQIPSIGPIRSALLECNRDFSTVAPIGSLVTEAGA